MHKQIHLGLEMGLAARLSSGTGFPATSKKYGCIFYRHHSSGGSGILTSHLLTTAISIMLAEGAPIPQR